MVGVGQNAHGALVLAAGGGCDAIAIVDGLWGTWLGPDAAIAAQYAALRSILADPGAIGPPPAVGLDPRATARLRRRDVGHLRPAVLGLGDLSRCWRSRHPRPRPRPRSGPSGSRWFGGPATLVELDDAAPAAVVAAVEAWRRALRSGRTEPPTGRGHGPSEGER